jgi:hypothetical protein
VLPRQGYLSRGRFLVSCRPGGGSTARRPPTAGDAGLGSYGGEGVLAFRRSVDGQRNTTSREGESSAIAPDAFQEDGAFHLPHCQTAFHTDPPGSPGNVDTLAAVPTHLGRERQAPQSPVSVERLEGLALAADFGQLPAPEAKRRAAAFHRSDGCAVRVQYASVNRELFGPNRVTCPTLLLLHTSHGVALRAQYARESVGNVPAASSQPLLRVLEQAAHVLIDMTPRQGPPYSRLGPVLPALEADRRPPPKGIHEVSRRGKLLVVAEYSLVLAVAETEVESRRRVVTEQISDQQMGQDGARGELGPSLVISLLDEMAGSVALVPPAKDHRAIRAPDEVRLEPPVARNSLERGPELVLASRRLFLVLCVIFAMYSS